MLVPYFRRCGQNNLSRLATFAGLPKRANIPHEFRCSEYECPPEASALLMSIAAACLLVLSDPQFREIALECRDIGSWVMAEETGPHSATHKWRSGMFTLNG